MAESLRARVLESIERSAHAGLATAARDALLCEALRQQAQNVAPYARLCRHRAIDPLALTEPAQFPALPTDVFRYARVAGHPEARDARVFRTSGTTSGARGVHAVSDLATYDVAARVFGKHALFPDVLSMRLIVLAPPASEVVDSSLSYMLTRFVEWFGDRDSVFVFRAGVVDVAALVAALDAAVAAGAPVALLGTSFAFVQAEDQLGPRRWSLPAGSRLMQTGGFKGKSREVEPATLQRDLHARYGIAEAWQAQEYGMTELCSQMYEATIVDRLRGVSAPRRMIAPPWVRVTAVDPETLRPVPPGAIGIARIDDLANLDSVCAIQTADRIRIVDDGFELLGRAPGSTPRGCSLAVEEALR